MSAVPIEKKPVKRQSDGPNAELMRAIGASSYTPIPPDQHAWQRAEAEHNPPLHRLWSWMIHNTLTWRHTTVDGEPKGYATSKDGVELHLEHAVKDLNMDKSNLNRAWREGVAIGLWRHGTKEEGSRRLILCGRVTPAKSAPEEPPVVCTDHSFSCFDHLPPYVRTQIFSKTQAEVKAIANWYSRHAEVERLAAADAMAAVRTVTAKIADEHWRQFGVDVVRLQDRKTQAPAEEVKARQARLDSLLPQVEQLVLTVAAKVAEPADAEELAALEAQVGGAAAPPRVQRSVQTTPASVQSEEDALYGPVSEIVQTEIRRPTLLTVATPRRGQMRAGGGVRSSAAPRDRDRSHDGEEHELLHAPKPSVLSTATDEERRLAAELVTNLAAVQKRHRTRFTGELLDPENKGDLGWAVKVVRTTGTEELEAFAPYVEQKAVKNALGVPVSVGLILEWAGDFRRAAGERERQRKAEAELEKKREAFNRASDENRAREQRTVEQVDAAMVQLSDLERKDRMDLAKQELKRDPNWVNLSAEQREDRAAVRVRAALRREIEAAAGGGK